MSWGFVCYCINCKTSRNYYRSRDRACLCSKISIELMYRFCQSLFMHCFEIIDYTCILAIQLRNYGHVFYFFLYFSCKMVLRVCRQKTALQRQAVPIPRLSQPFPLLVSPCGLFVSSEPRLGPLQVAK